MQELDELRDLDEELLLELLLPWQPIINRIEKNKQIPIIIVLLLIIILSPVLFNIYYLFFSIYFQFYSAAETMAQFHIHKIFANMIYGFLDFNFFFINGISFFSYAVNNHL